MTTEREILDEVTYIKNLNEREEKKMVQINRDEVEVIRRKYPKVKIHKTVGKYYITEYGFIMKFLKAYRSGKVED